MVYLWFNTLLFPTSSLVHFHNHPTDRFHIRKTWQFLVSPFIHPLIHSFTKLVLVAILSQLWGLGETLSALRTA